jgi:hypothetical protein
VNELADEMPPPGAGVDTVTVLKPKDVRSAALIVAFSMAVFTNVVGRGEPFQRTVEPATKLWPVTVSVNEDPPLNAEVGEMPLRTGRGFGEMLKVPPAEMPPPGAGLETVTVAEPTPAMSVVGIAACKWVAETNVVGRGEPFHNTVEDMAKLAPKRSKVKAGPLTKAPVGLMTFRIGTGVPATTNVELLPEDPDITPEVLIVIATLPAVVTSAAVMAACNTLEETKVVARLLPFHCTIEALEKLAPFTVRVNPALPAGTVFGVNEMIWADVTGVGEGEGMGEGVGTGVGVGAAAATDDPPPPQPAMKKHIAMIRLAKGN